MGEVHPAFRIEGDGDVCNVVVTEPPNMAGRWRITISKRPRVRADCIEGRFAPAQR